MIYNNRLKSVDRLVCLLDEHIREGFCLVLSVKEV